jgi:hypothetical protein
MTRPLTNTVQYFFHSTEHGKTIFILENRFGVTGYCFWFKLLEMLGNTENHFLDMNDELTLETLQAKARIDDPITTCSLLDLLSKLQAIDPELWEHKIVWSQNFVNGLEPVYKNRRRELPKKPVITSRKDITTSKKPSKEGITTSNNPTRYIGSKGSKEYCQTSDEVRLSSLLFDAILKRKPDFKKPNIQSWAKEMDLMLRVDKRDVDKIKLVIDWCQQDSFWQNNILSVSKLRKQFDRLELETLKLRNKNNGNNGGREISGEFEPYIP